MLHPLREGEMICPICGADDHKEYIFNGIPLLACPEAPDNQISMVSLEPKSVGFQVYECLECGRRDLRSESHLWYHLQAHRQQDDFEEASNYFGE